VSVLTPIQKLAKLANNDLPDIVEDIWKDETIVREAKIRAGSPIQNAQDQLRIALGILKAA